jgi:hypothetical protein
MVVHEHVFLVYIDIDEILIDCALFWLNKFVAYLVVDILGVHKDVWWLQIK